MRQNKKDKELSVIIILSIVTMVALGLTVWSVFFREPDIILTPDYAPQKIEQNQEPIANDSNEKMNVEKGGGAVSISYSDKVTVDLSDKKATLNFANPNKSTQDMVIQIVIQDQILVQSGKLTPGNKVSVLDLLNGAEKKLLPGGYEGKFTILYYDPNTGEKAVVNTEIPISVTVQE